MLVATTDRLPWCHLCFAFILALWLPAWASAEPFTYQGRLDQFDQPVHGTVDLQFQAFTTATGGSPLGNSQTFEDVPLEQGRFSVALQTTESLLAAPQRWLEIRVRPGGSTTAYTLLTPRQQLLAAPWALHSADTATLGGCPPAYFRGGAEWVNNYPRLASPHTQTADAGSGARAAAFGDPLLYLGAGNSGVVRTLFFTGVQKSSGGWVTCDELTTLGLRIYIDQGNVTNFGAIADSAKVVDFPLSMLFANELTTPTPRIINGKFIDLSVSSVNGVWLPGVRFKMPIPFSNGIVVQLYDRTDNSVLDRRAAWSWASYELAPLPADAFADWRLHSAYTRDATFQYGDRLRLLDRSGGSGLLLGIWTLVHGPLLDNWVDNNWKFWLDGEPTTGPPTFQASGYEDLMFNPFNGRAAGEHLGYEFGTLFADPGGSPGIASYQYMDRFDLQWTNGIVAEFPYEFLPASTIDMQVLLFYYAPR